MFEVALASSVGSLDSLGSFGCLVFLAVEISVVDVLALPGLDLSHVEYNVRLVQGFFPG